MYPADPHTDASDLSTRLREHLAHWGLRHFDSDAGYFDAQRRVLSGQVLHTLARLVQQKNESAAAETAFYDYSTRPDVLPILYSQRFEYYEAVGALLAARLGAARRILDVGCGPGILTTFYAALRPDAEIVGIDRSSACIQTAVQHAVDLGLTNATFRCAAIEQSGHGERYDLIMASHTLLQAERDPGVPSRNCGTFERPVDKEAQHDFEVRTGLGARLDAVLRCLAAGGRMLLFEKARLLGRRIGVQRALAARGWFLLEAPAPVRYRLVEEIADDGPLYHCAREAVSGTVAWDEGPEHEFGEERYLITGTAQGTDAFLDRLPDRSVTLTAAWEIPDGGETSVEAGLSGRALAYVRLTRCQGTGFVHGVLVGPQGGAVEDMAHRLDELGALCAQDWPAPIEASAALDLPLYEHHGPAAQRIWKTWWQRRATQTRTFRKPGGLEVYVEQGELDGLVYLYWANTFDQRQIVVMERARCRALDEYFGELVREGEASEAGRSGASPP